MRTPLILLALCCALPLAAGERWQKLDARGQPLADDAGPWACVRDQRTGLVWQNKSDNEGTHFEAATYSWYDGQRGHPDRGSCVAADMTVQPCDSADLVALARAQRWCGRADWRLPTSRELQHLLLDTGYAGAPRIATGYFPHTGRFPYWSADLRDDGRGGFQALLVHFGSGETLWLSTSQGARLRLVAGPSRR